MAAGRLKKKVAPRTGFAEAPIFPRWASTIERLIERPNPKAFVALQGFCDNRGAPEYNMELSRRRAETVADYLTKNSKLDSGRVVAKWYGETNPVASNDTAEGRAKNRRVSDISEVDSQINARLNARCVSRVRCKAFLTGSSNFSLLFHLFANG